MCPRLLSALGLITVTLIPYSSLAQESPPQKPPSGGQALPTTWDEEAWAKMWNALFQAEGGAARPVPASQDSGAWNVRWDNGLRVTSPDKAFDVKMGGRIMIDWSWVSADDSLKALVSPSLIEDGAEIRRARLFMEGTLYEDVIFKIQYDFATGEAEPKDVYLGMKDIPVAGTFRVGNQKESFSLETLTSSKYITFMERALPVEAFSPERNMGFQLTNTIGEDERLFWGAGFFRDSDLGSDTGDGDYNGVVRVSGLPWYEDDGARLLELGVSAVYNTDSMISQSTRPENHLIPSYVSTGNMTIDSETLVDLETALILGPLSFQGEYILDEVNLAGAGSATFDGWYAYVSYFLTGEHRNYRNSYSAFDRVSPNENFGLEGGSGAWELAARVSAIDLTDGPITGGKQTDYTFGVNWYLNPNTRVMLNWVHADLDTVGDSDSIAMRFQIDF